MLTNIYGAKCIGIEAIPVTVEVNITSGIGIHLVGLADTAVRESLLRTVTALQSLGYRIPGRKIVINLAPADMHKQGSGYDLPIAVGIIAASQQEDLPGISKYIIMGELGLDGSVRDVKGALPISEMAHTLSLEGCILPLESAKEAAECSSCTIYGVKSLAEVTEILKDTKSKEKYIINKRNTDYNRIQASVYPDFADIFGQEGAKRGLEIAAAGGHNVMMIGPPGSGKSTLAKALPGILPAMDHEEALQTSKIYSVAGKTVKECGLMRERPFRAPHQSSSVTAIIGGGADNIMPGEISLAHNGILFLDEFCEMPKRIMESLRAPMEDRYVTISRLRNKVCFPASFMLVAACNPCPCGYYGDGDRCTCSPTRREAYLSRLSGPIMDRIDIHLWMKPVETSKLIDKCVSESSAEIAKRVKSARSIQKERFKGSGIFTNAEMSGKMTGQFCRLDNECRSFLKKTVDNLGLSARACHRILKIARTIADIENSKDICLNHLSEASRYRFLDKRNQDEV